MSFFSRKKQQPAPQAPATVNVVQTPSQALAQLSAAAAREQQQQQQQQQQPGSLRGDSVLSA